MLFTCLPGTWGEGAAVATCGTAQSSGQSGQTLNSSEADSEALFFFMFLFSVRTLPALDCMLHVKGEDTNTCT